MAATVVLKLSSEQVTASDMEDFFEHLRGLITYIYHDEVKVHIDVEEED